jgi:hypothetical protein
LGFGNSAFYCFTTFSIPVFFVAMSESPIPEKLQKLLAATYADITMHAREEKLPTAERSFYSTRDFALGDTVACTAEAALENCEQIKSCFPSDVPESVFKNIDRLEDEIRRMSDSKGTNFIWKVVVPLVLLFIVGMAVRHLMHLR